MRRLMILIAALLAFALPAAAQIGKRVSIRAGTPEDRAISEITAATDPAQKLALLDQFLTQYGQGDMALAAYEIYVDHYLQAQNYDKAYEYGAKTLELDPDAYTITYRLFRAAQEQGNVERMMDYGLRIGEMVQRYKVRPAPEGMDDATWRSMRTTTLADNEANITYVAYTVFSTAYQTSDPATKAAQLERFVAAFPDSQYAGNALTVVAVTYQQMGQLDKLQAFGEKVLAADPNDVSMLLVLADSWSERETGFEKAEEYATRALTALESAAKPESVSDEQWAQQKSIQQGLAHSAIGQVNIRRNRNTPAVEELQTAAPLLQSDALSYARNQYRLGFALLNLRRLEEARQALTQAAEADTPYRQAALDKLNTLPAPARRRRP